MSDEPQAVPQDAPEVKDTPVEGQAPEAVDPTSAADEPQPAAAEPQPDKVEDEPLVIQELHIAAQLDEPQIIECVRQEPIICVCPGYTPAEEPASDEAKQPDAVDAESTEFKVDVVSEAILDVVAELEVQELKEPTVCVCPSSEAYTPPEEPQQTEASLDVPAADVAEPATEEATVEA